MQAEDVITEDKDVVGKRTIAIIVTTLKIVVNLLFAESVIYLRQTNGETEHAGDQVKNVENQEDSQHSTSALLKLSEQLEFVKQKDFEKLTWFESE